MQTWSTYGMWGYPRGVVLARRLPILAEFSSVLLGSVTWPSGGLSLYTRSLTASQVLPDSRPTGPLDPEL